MKKNFNMKGVKYKNHKVHFICRLKYLIAVTTMGVAKWAWPHYQSISWLKSTIWHYQRQEPLESKRTAQLSLNMQRHVGDTTAVSNLNIGLRLACPYSGELTQNLDKLPISVSKTVLNTEGDSAKILLSVPYKDG